MKDSIKDFGDQFKQHNKIDNYWGNVEMLKDVVNPFDLNLVKNKLISFVIIWIAVTIYLTDLTNDKEAKLV